jgi:hypothetical protein
VNAQNLSSARSLGACSLCTSHELTSLSNSASVGGASSAYAASATPPGSVRPQIAAGEAVVAATQISVVSLNQLFAEVARGAAHHEEKRLAGEQVNVVSGEAVDEQCARSAGLGRVRE